MIDVEYEGNTYRYYRTNSGRGYWVGIKGSRCAMYTGQYCTIPLGFYSNLRSQALKLGYSEDTFSPKAQKIEKKIKRSKRRTITDSNCIKIF